MNAKAQEVFLQMKKTVMETGAFKRTAKKLKKKAKKIGKRLLKRKFKND